MGIDRQYEAICSTLLSAWAPLPAGESFTTGAQKAESLAKYVETAWRNLGRPCSDKTIQTACAYADRRAHAFDSVTAVVAHGDAHGWNLLVDPRGGPQTFKFVDPDGLFVERAYDLGISIRELSMELLAGDAAAIGHSRCRQLGKLAGVEAAAIWQWGFLERTANGLLWLEQGMPDLAREFLVVADAWASAGAP